MTELKEIAMIVLRWLIPAVCGGALTWVVTYIKLRKKRDSAFEDGILTGFDDATYFAEV